MTTEVSVRHNWQHAEISALFDLSFTELMYRAQTVHRQFFDPNAVQISTLLSIKTGACPEDCKYCPQSIHHNAELETEKLMQVQAVLEEAQAAKTQAPAVSAWAPPGNICVPRICLTYWR